MFPGSWLWSLYASAVLLLASAALPSADTLTNEEYAVYSAVLAKVPTTRAHRNERLIILRDTLSPGELAIPTEACSSISADLRRYVDEVLTVNYPIRASSGMRLEDKKLVIGRPYVLITPQQANQWQQSRTPKISTDPPAEKDTNLFPGSTDLIRLSNVLFSADKKIALVYLSSTCGPLCGSSGWNIVKKTQNVWEVFSTPICGTIN